jgi:hypothetical protein
VLLRPTRPAHSLAQTRHITDPGEQPEHKHELNSGPRRQGAQPLPRRVGLRQHVVTSSKGRYWLNSPRWPGANTPTATVTVRGRVVLMTDCAGNGTLVM